MKQVEKNALGTVRKEKEAITLGIRDVREALMDGAPAEIWTVVQDNNTEHNHIVERQRNAVTEGM